MDCKAMGVEDSGLVVRGGRFGVGLVWVVGGGVETAPGIGAQLGCVDGWSMVSASSMVTRIGLMVPEDGKVGVPMGEVLQSIYELIRHP